MSRKRIAIILLLAAHALAVIVVFAAYYADEEFSLPSTPPGGLLARMIADIPEMLLISLPLSQGSLLAVWAAMSGRRRPWRFLAVLIAVAVIVKLLAPLMFWDLDEFAALLVIQFLAAVPFFFLLRLMGCELVSAPASPQADDSDGLRAAQFSLRSLMAWTTGLAVLLSLTSIIEKELNTMKGAEFFQIVLIFGLSGLLSLVTVRTALGSERTWLRGTVFGIAVAIVGTVLDMIENPRWTGYVFLIFFSSTTWTFASLWVFRALGYRLIRRTVRTESTSE